MVSPKIYGLIGYPVKHSLSPAMHNAAFTSLKINAEYKLFPLKEEEIAGFLKNLKLSNISGLNVTVPYKEKVLGLLDMVSAEAKLIGAVNTIKVTQDKLEGFNTDGGGFLKHLDELGINPKGKQIAIIGAGGASRAITVYLAKNNPEKISIFDLDRLKLMELVNHLRTNFKDIIIESCGAISDLDIENSDLLINATPVGMKENDPCLVAENLIHDNMLVYDLIYNPSETKLIKLARGKGAKTSNGLGMLLYQGMLAFEIWTDKEAPIEVMRKALEEAMQK